MPGEFEVVIEGRPAHITFSADRVQWKMSGSHAGSHVPTGSIIGIIPDVERLGDDTLLYLDHEEQNPEDKGRGNAKVRTVKITGLPSGFSEHRSSLPSYLQADSNEIHVVLSTLSGNQCASTFFSSALNPLLSSLKVNRYEVHKTQSSETIKELARCIFLPRALRGILQTIILLSGDGGLIDMVNVFSQVSEDATFMKPVMCLIPMGTGNGTANSTGLLSDSTQGLSSLLRGSPKDLPVFRARFPSGSMYLTDEGRSRVPVEADIYGVVVFSWGMHASLVADSDTAEYRKFGVDRFKMAAQELLHPSDGSESHRYRGAVTLVPGNEAVGSEDNEEKEQVVERQSHMYVLVTLVSQLEKGFMISPESKRLDGQLRIVHFGPLAPDRAMELMMLAYEGGKHTEQPEVAYAAVEAVKLQLSEAETEERWRRVCVDGNIVAVPPGGSVEVASSARVFLQLAVM